MTPTTATRILDAAEARFARHGYDATSLARIADDVGIRAPALYNHFEGKSHLYRRVLERLLEPFFAMLAEFGEPPHDPSRIEKLLEQIMLHHARHPNLARLVQHAVLAGGDQLETIVEGWYRPFFERIRERLAESAGLDPVAARWLPVVGIALNNLILGFVTLAPLNQRVLGYDASDPQNLQAQIHYLKHVARDLSRLQELEP